MFSGALRTKPGEWDRACHSAAMPEGAQLLTATSGKELEFDLPEVLAVPWMPVLSPYHLHKLGGLVIKQLNALRTDGCKVILSLKMAQQCHLLRDSLEKYTEFKNLIRHNWQLCLPASCPAATSQYCHK